MTEHSQGSMVRVGTMLSDSTTSGGAFQPLGMCESSLLEGKLVVVHCQRADIHILGRIAGIIPHNAFYTKGDAFSEARRQGMSIPSDVARQYQVCTVDLLQKLASGGSTTVTFPPHPGDPVYLYDPTQHEDQLFGFSRGHGDEKRVWFGTQVGYPDAPIALSVENMPEHMAVFGITGSGKSFSLGALIEQLAKIPYKSADGRPIIVPYPMLIVDANGDYKDYADKSAKEEIGAYGRGAIKRVVFPNSYQLEQSRGSATPTLQRLAVNLNVLSSRNLAEMIMEFYREGGEGTSALQVSAISRHLGGLGDTGHSHQDLFTTQFDTFRRNIEGDRNLQAMTKGAVLRALMHFHERLTEHHLLENRNCEWFDIDPGKIQRTDRIESLTKGEIAILDFSADGAVGVDLPLKQFVIGYLAAVLFRRFTEYKQQRDGARYLMFVIEEAQNFCPGRRYPIGTSTAKAKLSAIATQGRKFGLSLCLVSQRPSFVDEVVLSMCNTFFIHRVSPEDERFVKGVTGGLPESLGRRLTRLSKGECIVTGQMNKLPFPALIEVLRKARKVDHTAGRTNVVERIAQLRRY